MIGVLLIFGACTLWALDTLVRYPLLFGGTSAWSIVWFEHLLLVLSLSPWTLSLLRRLRRDRTAWVPFLVIGGLGSALGTVAFTQAFATINPSIVILIQKLQPVIAALLAGALLGERIDRRFFVWLAVCLVGSAMIAWPDLALLLDPGTWRTDSAMAALSGYGLALFAVLAWGASTVFGKGLSVRGYGTRELLCGRFLFASAVLTPVWLVAADAGEPFAVSVAGPILLMVMLSGIGGMSLYYFGMRRLPARSCAVAEMFFPVAAVTINWFAPHIDASLSPVQIAGAAILLVGSTRIAITQLDDARAIGAHSDEVVHTGGDRV